MSIHILCCRVCNDVTTPLKRTTVNRCSKRVVYNQWYSMLMCHTSKTFDIKYLSTRVRDCFTKETLCIRAESSLYLLIIPVWVNERTFNTQFLHRNPKEVECTPIDGIRSHEMVACPTQINNCIEVGSLP